MASLKKNIAANLVGRVWSAALTLLLIPVYIRLLGIEAYGLIGFYTTLLASLAILDLGLSTTLNRELAMAKALRKDPQQVRNLVFSLETIYFLIGLVVGIAVVLLAPALAKHWIKVEQIPLQTVSQSLMLMGVVIAFQWSISLYNGGLLGLEKQVLYNVMMVVMTTVRAAGVLLLFFWTEPSVQAFFIWQAAISLLYVISMRMALWSSLDKGKTRPVFSKQQIKGIARFASGMTGVGLTAFLLAQVDKVVLSKLLPLTQYGYYTLALTLTSAVGTLITPVYTAAFPRFSAMISVHDSVGLKKTYHAVCRLVATIVFPVGLFITFFAQQILYLWTKDQNTVQQCTSLVQVLGVSVIFSCLISVPVVLIQAHGDARFILVQNTVACLVLVPLLFILTNLYGSMGGALVLLLLNAGYVFISLPLINHRLFKGEILRWYWEGMILPLIAPLAFLLVAKLVLDLSFPGLPAGFWWLGSIAGGALMMSFLFNTQVRQWLLQMISLKFRQKVIV